jgi:DNA-directed RNA polymerase subunit RPC12/RpoP
MADMKFECPHCQQHIQADDGYAGMQINCPACNGGLVVPGVARAPEPPAPPPPAATRLAVRATPPTPAPAESATPPAPAPSSRTGGCPSCGVALPRGAVLCTNCGYNLVTRQRTVAGKPAALGKPRVQSGEAPWYLTPWPYVGLVVLLIAIFYFTGMMIPLLGVVVLYVFTVHILVVIAAFHDSVVTGLLALCIPIYTLYWVFKHSENDTLKVLYGFAFLLNIGIRVLAAMMGKP